MIHGTKDKMKRAVIIAKGEVQRVGYRDVVEKIARKLKLTGFVANLKPYDVRIVAEGEEDVLNEFAARIRITKDPIAQISVEDLEVVFQAATGEFEYFEIKRGDWHEELAERMDTAGTLLYRSVEIGTESVEIGKKMLEKQDSMLDKQDRTIEILEDVKGDTSAMLEKQDRTIEILEDVKEDTSAMLEKQDRTIEILEDVKEDTGEVTNALPFLKEIYRETTELRDKYEMLSRDVDAIKVKLKV